MSLLIGALLTAGLILISPRPAELLRPALAAGATALLWQMLWLSGLHLLIAALPAGTSHSQATEGLLTLAVAGTAMLLTALILLVGLVYFGAVRPDILSAALVTTWTAGLILPSLGRNGVWPAESVVLAATAIFLSLPLGVLLSSIGPLSLRRRR